MWSSLDLCELLGRLCLVPSVDFIHLFDSFRIHLTAITRSDSTCCYPIEAFFVQALGNHTDASKSASPLLK